MHMHDWNNVIYLIYQTCL